MPSATVKWYDSTMGGAPTLTGQAGSLIGLLDALLVNGFNLRAATSLVVASDVATLDFGTAHGFVEDQLILVAGATPSGLNGEQRVLSITTNTVTFTTSGISDQTATGSITAKAAPLGWSKLYSGTNKATYQRPDVDATAMLLRVDDTASGSAKYAGVRMYESMTDVDTGSVNVASLTWFKSSTADATQRPWRLYGDGKRMFFLPQWTSSGVGDPYLFGDLVSYKAGDAYHCLLTGTWSTSSSYPGAYNAALVPFNTSTPSFYGNAGLLMRAYTQAGSAIQTRAIGFISSLGTASLVYPFGYSDGYATPYPNAIDGALHLRGAVEYVDGSSNGHFRGRMPGLYPPAQGMPLADGDVVKNINGLSGRSLRAQGIAGYYGNNTNSGRIFIDITGPWT